MKEEVMNIHMIKGYCCKSKTTVWYTKSMGSCWSKRCGPESDQNHRDVSSENVHRISTMESWEEKLSEANRDGKIVLANFSAGWCNPCRAIVPVYCELANKYNSIVFLTVDVDELTELSTSWDVTATPTFFFLKDGRQLDKLVGANKLDLQKKIAAMADLAIKSRS
ncbi:Thioredoxin [Quillaja saponaria]|uniref:Thioredoxin n=1 Tax=Quillaja saponaria TaxID=32244 RepID=A0AAD7LLI9_QUISA|nr:Thioredoxin [Quillaja saponaria]